MSEETNKNQYSADSIQALEGMEHVSMRPSMYIGDVGTQRACIIWYMRLLITLLMKLLAGHCDRI